jgi:uncharacterized hydrophobic protein (TIGR00271 family)
MAEKNSNFFISIFKWMFGWLYLVELPNPQAEIEVIVKKGSTPDNSFIVMIIVSSVVATIGLLANSTAVIIGAMIIAPLMSPIIALSYWLLAGNWIVILRSLLTVILGTILSIAVAYFITELIGWKLAGSEIMARMKPNLLDLGVALAAGTAGAFAYTRASVSASFAGIAIAVALVPPLCTVGIAFAIKNEAVGDGVTLDYFDPQGPLLLYITNLIGIIFASSTVFFWQYFRKRLKAIFTLVFTIVCLGIILNPLGISMKNLMIRNQIRRNLTVLTISLLPKDYNKMRLRNLNVRIGKDIVYVRANAIAQPGVVNQEFIDKLRDGLSKRIDMPITLEVGVIEEPVMKSTIDLTSPLEKKGIQ